MAWLWLTLGGTNALLGVWVAVRSLLCDRARGRPRCARCWYDLEGIASMRCPECGWAAKNERQVLRTRRRWKRAFFALILVVLGIATASWPVVRKAHWSTYVPMHVLYWAAASEDEASFAVSASTTGSPTRWNWAQEAYAINNQLLGDLESGELDEYSLNLDQEWWSIIERRLQTGGSGVWPTRRWHSETICKAIQRPQLNPFAREMFLRWLRGVGAGSAREGRVAKAWIEDDWVGPVAAGTLLYLRRYEDVAIDRLQQELEDPNPMRRVRVMETIVDRGDQVQAWRVPSPRVLELIQAAMEDESEVVRFGAVHAARAILRQIRWSHEPNETPPRWLVAMVVDLGQIMEDARTKDQSRRVAKYIGSFANDFLGVKRWLGQD